ncbi:MAG: prolyl aminopeptidase [Acidimicrobiales bacterium]
MIASTEPAVGPAGYLDVGDGNRVWWYEAGDPDGTPAVVLHGGPGSGSNPGVVSSFDQTAYRLVLFDQRQCGRSEPHASDLATDLATNTTEHLLADLERLREHRGVERWVVYGHSWGALLGARYAQRHPRRVRALVLVGCPVGRRSEIDWLYRGLAMFLPAEFERFGDVVAPADRDGDLIEAYNRLVHDGDPEVRRVAAAAFHDWEWASVSADAGREPPSSWFDPAFQLARARIVTHFFGHNCWLGDDTLLGDADSLAGIPGVLITGRLDLCTPVEGAWQLARAWPDAELVIVPDAGHFAGDVGMHRAIRAATDRFASS